MKCEDIKHKLFLFIDQELNDQERKIIKDHLSVCADCQKELTRLKSINAIGKTQLFDEPEPEYWQNLTGAIMNKIHPTEEKQPFWNRLLNKIENSFLLTRINYRMVGLAAATVILIFFVKITFFNQGKFNIPLEMSEINTLDEKTNYKDADKSLTEYKAKHKIVEEEETASKPSPTIKLIKKGTTKRTSPIIDGVRLGTGAKEKNEPPILSARGKGDAPIKSDAQLKSTSEKESKELFKDEVEIVDENEEAVESLAEADKSHQFELAVKKESKTAEHKKETAIGGIKKQTQYDPQTEMVRQSPSIPADAENQAPKSGTMKIGSFKFFPVSIQADNSVDKADPFFNVLQAVYSEANSEEKINILKAYFIQYPNTIHKNQATYLLAENLILFANETKSERTIDEAVLYFQENEKILKENNNYKLLKDEIQKLKKEQ